MAQLPNTGSQTMEDFSPIPAGDYLAQIISTKIEENKSGTGHNFIVEHEFLDEKLKGRKFRSWYAINHPNAETKEIAYKSINTIKEACKIPFSENNSEKLHGVPHIITMKCDLDDKYPNSISFHKPIESRQNDEINANDNLAESLEKPTENQEIANESAQKPNPEGRTPYPWEKYDEHGNIVPK